MEDVLFVLDNYDSYSLRKYSSIPLGSYVILLKIHSTLQPCYLSMRSFDMVKLEAFS